MDNGELRNDSPILGFSTRSTSCISSHSSLSDFRTLSICLNDTVLGIDFYNLGIILSHIEYKNQGELQEREYSQAARACVYWHCLRTQKANVQCSVPELQLELAEKTIRQSLDFDFGCRIPLSYLNFFLACNYTLFLVSRCRASDARSNLSCLRPSKREGSRGCFHSKICVDLSVISLFD